MRRRSIIAIAGISLLALVAWLGFPERGAPPVAPLSEAPSSTPVEETLRGRPLGIPTGAKPAPGESPDRPRPPSSDGPRVRPGEVRWTGQIRDADGKRVNGGQVWLVDPGDEATPRHVLGEARVSSDGAYAITAAPTELRSSIVPRLCVAISGEESMWLDAGATAGGAADVTLPSARMPLTGRVTDSDGKPVADLALRVTDAWTSQQWIPLAAVPAEADVASALGETHFTRTRTDADGRFSVRTGFTRGLGLVSESPDWFIRTRVPDLLRQGLDPAVRSIDVLAEPAVALVASVRDAKSGDPVPAFGGHAHDASGSMFVPFDGASGALAIRWPRWWRADERVTIQLDVEAKQFAPAQTFVVFEAGAREAKTDVSMTPATPDARADVTFDIRDAKGEPFDGDWVARIVDARNADKTVMELRVERVGAGLYRAPIAAGRWPLLVKTGDGLGFVRRVIEADVVAGVPSTIRCDMPAHGSLKLSWPAPERTATRGSATAPWLTVSPANGDAGSMVPIDSENSQYRAPALPEGDWTLRLYPGGLGSKPYERTARIVAGTETTVEFAKP